MEKNALKRVKFSNSISFRPTNLITLLETHLSYNTRHINILKHEHVHLRLRILTGLWSLRQIPGSVWKNVFVDRRKTFALWLYFCWDVHSNLRPSVRLRREIWPLWHHTSKKCKCYVIDSILYVTKPWT